MEDAGRIVRFKSGTVTWATVSRTRVSFVASFTDWDFVLILGGI